VVVLDGIRRTPPVAAGSRDKLRAEIDRLRPQGATGLYDTALAAVEHVQKTARTDTINAVVLLTDGRNEVQQSITLDRLLSGLGGKDPVRVFTIAYGAERRPRHPEDHLRDDERGFLRTPATRA